MKQDKIIGDYLIKQGFKRSCAGYRYAIELIKLYIEDKGMGISDAYCIVGNKLNIGYTNVERCVRYLIQKNNASVPNKEFIVNAAYELEEVLADV